MPLLLVVVLGLIDLSFQTPAPSGVATHLTIPPIRCEVFDSEYGDYGYGQPLPPDDAWCVPIVFAPITP